MTKVAVDILDQFSTLRQSQKETHGKRTFRTASESGKNDVENVPEAPGRMLKGIHGGVSFTAMHFQSECLLYF